MAKQRANADSSGSVVGHRAHLVAGPRPCEDCLDSVAIAELADLLATMRWPTERVALSVLMERRPDLALLPLAGSSLAAGLTEGV
ncbi:MAG: hypothetical protein JWQ32_566 [Marmoricola sp.]|nr:hypothetical protein [Marmoricola sp.]